MYPNFDSFQSQFKRKKLRFCWKEQRVSCLIIVIREFLDISHTPLFKIIELGVKEDYFTRIVQSFALQCSKQKQNIVQSRLI